MTNHQIYKPSSSAGLTSRLDAVRVRARDMCGDVGVIEMNPDASPAEIIRQKHDDRPLPNYQMRGCLLEFTINLYHKFAYFVNHT